MNVHDHLRALSEKRKQAHTRLSNHIDECIASHPGKGLTAEERAVHDSLNAEMDAYEGEIARFTNQETREAESAAVRMANPAGSSVLPAARSGSRRTRRLRCSARS